MPRKWATVSTVSMFVLALALAGCGGGSASTNSKSSAASSPTSTATQSSTSSAAATSTSSALTSTSSSATPATSFADIQSPSFNIQCEVGAPPGENTAPTAFCQTQTPGESVTLSADGDLSECQSQSCLGDAADGATTLAYGQKSSVPPFTCVSATTGITCAVADGKGFLINDTGISAVSGKASGSPPAITITAAATATATDYGDCVASPSESPQQWLTAVPDCTTLLNPTDCQSLLQVTSGSISCQQAVPAAAIANAQSLINQANLGPLDILGITCYSSDQGINCSRGNTMFTVSLP